MIIAVDTGGTKTLVVRFSEAGAIEEKIKFPTPDSSEEYITLLAGAVSKLAGSHSPSVISVALPDVTKGKIASNIVEVFSHLPWKDFDVVFELSSHFPTSRIIVANDANLGGLGEARSLAKAPPRVLYVTISTGIGTGVVINGSLDSDYTRAEGGHLMLEYNGTLGDWDAFGSGKAVYETYGKYASDITSKHAWRDITDRISRGFFALIPIIRPDTIIIGGSMGTHFNKYGDSLIALLKEKLPPTIAVPEIIQAKHPEAAVIYGCYYYAIDSRNLS